VILQSKSRSLQHGIQIRPGSLVIHRPRVEHDGVYGRNFKVVCFSVRDELFAKHIRRLSPQLQDAMRQPWSVFEPPATLRQDVIRHFAEAASIIQSDPRVRNSTLAVAKFEEELVFDFLEAVAQQFPTHSTRTDERAAAMVRQVDQDVKKSILVRSSVAVLCICMRSAPTNTVSRVPKCYGPGSSYLSPSCPAEWCPSGFAAEKGALNHGDRCCPRAGLLAPRTIRRTIQRIVWRVAS
jgi:hypothetical protein